MAEFVNWRTQSKSMNGAMVGLLVLGSVLARGVDVSIGLALLFSCGVYINRQMRRAFLAPVVPEAALAPRETGGPLGL